MERKEGYYWVRSLSGWHVAHFDGNNFADGIGLHSVKPIKLLEINETRIPTPDEEDPPLTDTNNKIFVTSLDYRLILKKYINHVYQTEGTNFFPGCNNHPDSDVTFTDAEIRELENLI